MKKRSVSDLEHRTRGVRNFSACAAMAASMVVAACSQTSAQQARRPAPGEVVATVGSAAITLAEVDDKALEQPAANFGGGKLSTVLYEARRAAIEELIAS